MEGLTAPSGDLSLRVFSRQFPDVPVYPAHELTVAEVLHHGAPRPDLSDEVNRWRRSNLRNLWRGAWRTQAARTLGIPAAYGRLWLTVLRADESTVDLGLASLRVVTTAGVNYIVDAFQNTTELENMKFHGFGTGTNAEATGDTALQTEETTQYNPDSTRPTGSTTEGASANIYRTVATYTPDSGFPRAITEHGIFSASSAGTLLDRSQFSAVNLASGDSLQTTYDLTFTAGS